MSIIRTILDDIEALFQRIRDEVAPHQTSSDAASYVSKAAEALKSHPDAEPEAPEAGSLAAQTDQANLKAAGIDPSASKPAQSASANLSGDISDDSKPKAVSDSKFSEDQG